MADKDKKSLADLAKLTESPRPSAEPAAEAAGRSRGEAAARRSRVAADAAEARGRRCPERRSAAPEAEAAAPASARSEGGDRRGGRRGKDEEVNKDGVDTQGPQIKAVLREQQLDKQGRAYATGRRKDAVARVWLKPGSGKIVVNGRDQTVYFARPTLRLVINQVFDITERRDQYDVVATVQGGGLSGQAGAVRHGISTALTRYEPGLRTTVKQAGFLTRDPRVVERKKYGRAKARRSFQFSKR